MDSQRKGVSHSSQGISFLYSYPLAYMVRTIFWCLIFSGNCKRHHFWTGYPDIYKVDNLFCARHGFTFNDIFGLYSTAPKVLLHYIYATQLLGISKEEFLKDLNFTILYISFSSSRSFLIHLSAVCRMVKIFQRR